MLFSNAGTLSKFNRLGVLAGFKPSSIRYFRTGFRYNSDPDAESGTPFSVEVGEEGYQEGWADELQIFHNPRAIAPLSFDHFGPLNQHVFDGDQIITHYGAEQIISSFTFVLQPEKK